MLSFASNMGACMASESPETDACRQREAAETQARRQREADRKDPPILLHVELEGVADRCEIRVRPHDPVESWQKRLLELYAGELEEHILPSELCLTFGGVAIEAQRSVADYDVEDGACLRLRVDNEAVEARLEAENRTPPEAGLVLWLTARDVPDSAWRNPKHPTGIIMHSPQAQAMWQSDGPYMSFGYNTFGTLSQCLPCGVRTIISVHTMARKPEGPPTSPPTINVAHLLLSVNID